MGTFVDPPEIISFLPDCPYRAKPASHPHIHSHRHALILKYKCTARGDYSFESSQDQNRGRKGTKKKGSQTIYRMVLQNKL